jgi:hypothetical protein
MVKTETVLPNATGTGPINGKTPSAIDRLRDKAAALRGPRGKYRCRKCHELPCVCPDLKRSEAAEVSPAAEKAKGISGPLFTETNSKRLLEVGFGIPVVLTNCKLWALSEEEALELSKPTADVLNEFVTVDPKWAMLSILCVSLGSIVARKAVLYSAWKRAMAIEQRRQSQVKPESDKTPEPPESNEPKDKAPGPSVTMDMLQ